MITINLYDYRQQLKNMAIQKQALAAAGVVVVAFFLIAMNWFVEAVGRDKLRVEILEVEGKIKALDGKVQAVNAMKKKQKRVQQITDGFRKLKTGQYLSMTRLLDDVSQALPEGVWFESIVQAKWKDLKDKKIPVIFIRDPAEIEKEEKEKKEKKEKKDDKEDDLSSFVEIKGKTQSDAEVARFIEGLEKIPYFKTVFLFKSQMEEGGVSTYRRFTVYCYMGEMKIAA